MNFAIQFVELSLQLIRFQMFATAVFLHACVDKFDDFTQ